jgi:hypothetical protein
MVYEALSYVKLLVYAALSYYCMRPEVIAEVQAKVGKLEALSYWCTRP